MYMNSNCRIIREGDTGHEFFIVEKGAVNCYKTTKGS